MLFRSVPLEVYPSPHATAFGVAALAQIGLGTGAPGTVVGTGMGIGTWRPERTVEPHASGTEAEERIRRWKVVADATMLL